MKAVWWCYTQISGSIKVLFCSQLNWSRRSRQIFTRFTWLQPGLPTYNLPTLPNMPSISLHKSVIRRRYGNLSRFWSNSVGLCPQWFGTWATGSLDCTVLQPSRAWGLCALHGEQENAFWGWAHTYIQITYSRRRIWGLKLDAWRVEMRNESHNHLPARHEVS